MDIDKQSIVDFSQIISDRYDQLTKGEKRIANYIRKNQEESAFLTAVGLAACLGLSEATLVRFARSMGFNSYPAMRTSLQEDFLRRIKHSARLRSHLKNISQGETILESLVASEIEYLSQALETVDQQALKKTVELMHTCDHIYIFSIGPSISLANLMEIRLRRYGCQIITLTTTGREILEPLRLMKQNDMLFMIRFFEVFPAQKLVLEYAHEVKCPVVILTDNINSVITDKADIVLAARRSQMAELHSLVVPITIINTLLLMFADEDRNKIMTSIDDLDQLRERLKNTD